MNKTLPLLLLFMSSLVLASSPCGRTKDQIKQMLHDTSSRISFKNEGGLFNGGVCWWHSRLQRSSAYLIHFEPKKNPPSPPELQKILYSLRTLDRVVIIPGYSDFYSFSKDYQHELQALLNQWQKIDGVLNFEWIRGISGKWQLSSGDMIQRMNNVFHYYQSSPAPVWVMAQMKGVTSHALLVLSMARTANGFDLEVIDSNYPDKTIALEYYEGDRYLRTAKGVPFVPYVGFQNDFRLIFAAVRKSCGEKDISLQDLNVRDGDVELTYSTGPQY